MWLVSCRAVDSACRHATASCLRPASLTYRRSKQLGYRCVSASGWRVLRGVSKDVAHAEGCALACLQQPEYADAPCGAAKFFGSTTFGAEVEAGSEAHPVGRHPSSSRASHCGAGKPRPPRPLHAREGACAGRHTAVYGAPLPASAKWPCRALEPGARARPSVRSVSGALRRLLLCCLLLALHACVLVCLLCSLFPVMHCCALHTARSPFVAAPSCVLAGLRSR